MNNKNNNQSDSKIRSLVRFNEDIFFKTTLALQTIDRFEVRNQPFWYMKKKMQLYQQQQQKKYDIHQSIQSSKIVLHYQIQYKINLIGNNIQYYKIQCKQSQFPLKIHFKNVKNTTLFYASFHQKYPTSQKNDFAITIQKQFRKIFSIKNSEIKFLYFNLKSNSKISSLNIKINNNKIVQTIKLKTQRKITQNSNNTQFRLNTQRSQKIRLLPLKPVLSTSISFRKINKKLQKSNKQKSENKQSIKILLAKSRKQQLQGLKQKSRLLKQLMLRSKQHILMKQQQFQKQNNNKKQILKKSVALIKCIHLFRYIQQKKQDYCFNIRKRLKFINYEVNFKKILKIKLIKMTKLINKKQNRDQACIKSCIYLTGNIIKRNIQKKAGKIINSLLNFIYLTEQINKCFQLCTQFRRNLRFIQKYWRFKYNTRKEAIKQFGLLSIDQIIKQFPKFRVIQKQLMSSQKVEKLIIEYIKQTTQKFNRMYLIYLQKKQEMQEMKQFQQIMKKNKKVLMAKINKEIQIFKISKPYYRFFRDLDILKSNIRTWFQIEYKRKQKKNRKNHDLF